jgi:hypothetical protein
MNLSYLQYTEIPEQVFLSSLRDTEEKILRIRGFRDLFFDDLSTILIIILTIF